MSVLPNYDFEKIHTGSAIETRRLQDILEEQGIPSIIRDDNESAKLGGFALGTLDHSRLLVVKEHFMKAKLIIVEALEDFKANAISDDALTKISQNADNKNVASSSSSSKETKKPAIPTGLVLFYVAFLIYCLWRLSPLLEGAELPYWRITISGVLSIYCLYRIVSYFKQR